MTTPLGSPFLFRSATGADTEAITHLVNLVYRGETGARSWTGEAHILAGQRVDVDGIKAMLASDGGRILLASISPEARDFIGCVYVQKQGERCYLGMLTVHVEAQKSGLGRALLAEAERVAREEFGCREMYMSVISLRTELIEWYERRGYAWSGEKRPFPYGDERFGIPLRDDLEFVLLAKQLK